MNRVILMGRATDDPQVVYTQDKTPVARFSMAIDRMKEGTDFPSINAWGKTAETIEKYVRKGTKILVEGRLKTGSYTNKDGNKVYTTDVVCERFEFAESKKSEGTEKDPVDKLIDDFLSIPDGMDEMPFK